MEDSGAEVDNGDYALLSLVLKDEEGTEVVNEPGTMFHLGNNKFYTGLEEHVLGILCPVALRPNNSLASPLSGSSNVP